MLLDGVYVDSNCDDYLFVKGKELICGERSVARIVADIPRFVEDEYTSDFGSQWVRFPRTQLDSSTGQAISEERLARCLGTPLSNIRDKLVLEAGSGAGRFTEVLLKYGAVVHSFDKSCAVEVNLSNNSQFESLAIAQADILHMPYKSERYDLVLCLGVLQHTPSPEESILKLWEKVKPGGILVFDHYPKNWRICAPWPLGEAIPIYRRFILLFPRRFRFELVKRLVSFWFPVHWTFRFSPFIQRILRRLSPVITHFDYVALQTREMYFEWALLDTHDATTDYFKHRRSLKQLKQFVESSLSPEYAAFSEGGNGIEVRIRKKEPGA